ncbi:MAG: AAA family ATPase [Rhodospirillales bacterium]
MHPLRAGLVIKSQDLLNEVHACLRPLPVRVVMEQPTLGETSLFLNQLEQARVDVLLIDLTRLAEPFEQVARRIKTLSAAPMIVALNDTADPEVILGAIRAGANEFLYPPLEAGLQKALERISSERLKQQAAGRQRGKILGFLSAKGGCGATTIACHVAVELQRATSQQVLLADLDLDTGMVGFLMKTRSQYSIMDAVMNVHRLDLSYWKALVSNGHEHLEVITAPQAASPRGAVDPEHFRQVLQFLRSAYDWVVVDLGRSASPLAFGVLDELDGLYLISTMDLPALHLSKQVVQNLTDAGFGRNRLHLVMNRAPKRSDILPSELQRVLGLPIFEFLPNDYPVLYEAYAEGSLLTANSELGKAMAGLAMKIAGVKPKEKPKQKLNLSIF